MYSGKEIHVHDYKGLSVTGTEVCCVLPVADDEVAKCNGDDPDIAAISTRFSKNRTIR
ncbi:MAG: hypothetical protein JST76_03425 [Bacteroidetes bacterium]|nr:hypothetical protein [Bacteroidota bacterium]MBS1617540.1 hypothetical protein [Bacteroidota bacterium]